MKNNIFFKILLISSSLFLFSCKNNNKQKTKEDQVNHIVQARKYLSDYKSSKDEKYLENSYTELNKDPDFVKNGINNNNRRLVTSLLMYLKKYDELKILVEKDTLTDGFNKKLSSNLLNSLEIYDKDKQKALEYMKENYRMAQERVNHNPNDSLVYIDFFMARAYLTSKEQAVEEIDSMKSSNKNYSNMFYEDILKDVIHDYPKEWLYPSSN